MFINYFYKNYTFNKNIFKKMLDGMFLDDDNDVSTSNNNKNLKNPHLNCASYTNKPDPPRGESNFVGLLNQ